MTANPTATSRVPITAFCVILFLATLWGATGSPPWVLAPVIWLGGFWLPGSALAIPRSVPSERRFDALWIPLALGPVLFGAGICLGRLAGWPLATSVMIPVAVGAAALLARLWVPKLSPQETGSGTPKGKPGSPKTLQTGPFARNPWLLPLLVGTAILLLGALPSLIHQPLRLRDDALLHLPVIQRVLAGSFPPENPFLAGEPLAYFWFYHVTLAGMIELTGLPTDLVPAIFNTQALLLLLLALDRVGRHFGLDPIARAATLALVGLGLTPWGWARLVYFQATNPDINWALFRATGISALLPILNPSDPRLAAALTKIAMTNALPMSLALVALAAFRPEKTNRATWARHAIFLAGCLAFHLATGILLAAGLGLRWAMARMPIPRRGLDAAAMVAMVAGVAAVSPYLIHVLRARSGSGAVTLAFQGGRALELHLALIGVYLLALPGIRAWIRGPRTRLWLATGIPAFLLPFVAHLIDGNEYKSIFFLLVIWVPLAGDGLNRLVRGKTVLALLVLVLFTPTAYLAARGYVTETPKGALRTEERATVGRLGEALPSAAVIWKPDPGRGYSRFTYSLGRPSYLSDPYALQIMGQWDSEEARWRRGSLALAGVAERVPHALAAAQSRLGSRPLYVLVTPGVSRRYPHLEPALTALGLTAMASNQLFGIYALPSAPKGTQQKTP
jgi:hypothetical protein